MNLFQKLSKQKLNSVCTIFFVFLLVVSVHKENIYFVFLSNVDIWMPFMIAYVQRGLEIQFPIEKKNYKIQYIDSLHKINHFDVLVVGAGLSKLALRGDSGTYRRLIFIPVRQTDG